MEPRRETRREHVADTIRFVLLPSWRQGLAALVIIGTVILLGLMLRARSMLPAETHTAEIVRFGLYPSPGATGDTPVIVVRHGDGTTFELRPANSNMVHCRAGDRITFTTGPSGTRIDRCDRSIP